MAFFFPMKVHGSCNVKQNRERLLWLKRGGSGKPRVTLPTLLCDFEDLWEICRISKNTVLKQLAHRITATVHGCCLWVNKTYEWAELETGKRLTEIFGIWRGPVTCECSATSKSSSKPPRSHCLSKAFLQVLGHFLCALFRPDLKNHQLFSPLLTPPMQASVCASNPPQLSTAAPYGGHHPQWSHPSAGLCLS